LDKALKTHFEEVWCEDFASMSKQVANAKWKEYIEHFHSLIDTELAGCLLSFHIFLAERNTDAAWRVWGQAIENAANIILGHTRDMATKFSGRGRPHFKVWQHTGVPLIVQHDGKTFVTAHSRAKTRVQQQLGRAKQWVARSCNPKGRALPHNSTLNQQALRLLVAHGDAEDALEQELLGALQAGSSSTHQTSITLKKMVKHYGQVFHTLCGMVKQEKKEHKVQTQAADKANHLKASHKTIKGGGTAPLLFVRRTEVGPQGQPKGSIATHPDEVDDIVRKAWAKIYKGNVTDEAAHLAKFCNRSNNF